MSGIDFWFEFGSTYTYLTVARLRRLAGQAQRLGLFGSPTFLVRGEMFWGDDRLEQALAWARAREAGDGTRQRSGSARHRAGDRRHVVAAPGRGVAPRGLLLAQDFAWGVAQGPVRSEPWDGPTGTRVTLTLPPEAPAIDFEQVMAQAQTWRAAHPGLRIEVACHA